MSVFVYLTATTTRPTITCPSWCEVTQDEHIDDLEAWEGRAVHQWHVATGMQSPALDKFDLSAGVALCADGSPSDHRDDGLTITIEGQEYTPKEALAIARAIKTLVKDVRR